MICVQNPTSGEVKRVPDTEAHRLVGYGWRYVPKAEYKRWQVSKLQDLRQRSEFTAVGSITGRRF